MHPQLDRWGQVYKNNRMRLWISRHVSLGGGRGVDQELTAQIKCPIWSKHATGPVRSGWKVFLSVEQPVFPGQNI